MSESIGKPPQLTMSVEQGHLAYSFLKGALPQVIAWMRSDGSAYRTAKEWANILEEQMAAAEGYAREGR